MVMVTKAKVTSRFLNYFGPFLKLLAAGTSYDEVEEIICRGVKSGLRYAPCQCGID